MKNSLNLVLAILFFVVLGCSCPNMEELAKKIDESSKNSNSTSNSNSSTTPGNSSNSKSSTKAGNLTLEKYNRIKNGMTYQEVVEILGSEGVEQMRSGSGKYEVASYKWEGENYAFISIVLMGDKVNSKTQYGMK